MHAHTPRCFPAETISHLTGGHKRHEEIAIQSATHATTRAQDMMAAAEKAEEAAAAVQVNVNVAKSEAAKGAAAARDAAAAQHAHVDAK
jgi:hypothetical protein